MSNIIITDIEVRHVAYAKEAKTVAWVTAPKGLTWEADDINTALEYAFEKTNNISGSWSMGPEIDGQHNPDYSDSVRVVGGRDRKMGLRSTSMFDVVCVHLFDLDSNQAGAWVYKCDALGWTRLYGKEEQEHYAKMAQMFAA